MKIIGIGHRSRVGKDTLAKFITQYLRLNSKNLRITRISFATKLKAVCYDLYKHLGLKDEDYYNDPAHEHERDIVLPAIGKTPVQIWVNFGTLVGREVYPDTWVDYGINKAKEGAYDVVLTPDVRFLNETAFILKEGGYVFELENPRVPPRNSIAEQQLKDWTGWTERFVNDTDLRNLMNIAENICNKYIFEKTPKEQRVQPAVVPMEQICLCEQKVGGVNLTCPIHKEPDHTNYLQGLQDWREKGGTPD